MANQAVTQPCQYCSVTSKSNKEDPIGTAVTARLWLFIEIPQPWAKNPWQGESASLQKVFASIENKTQLWRDLRILAIAPDKTDSTPSNRHVFFYTQPLTTSATYTQQHYHIPTDQLHHLLQALVIDSTQIDQFSHYQQPAIRNFFVCTHTNYDLACGRFGTPLYRTLRKEYAQEKQLSVWQTTHFGGHNFAPTLIDFPTGHFWGHLEPEILDILVHRRGDITKLRQFYRGWSGCEPWAQIAERSLWMQQGWKWLNTSRTMKITRQDPGQFSHRVLRWLLPWVPTIGAHVLLKKLSRKLAWAEVEICWKDNEGKPFYYSARVEKSHTITSQMKSGEAAPLISVPQYQVNVLQSNHS
ncbi:MAG: sucrase ferredoxin [Cyanobacteria bacterium P01_D01_bin.36]